MGRTDGIGLRVARWRDIAGMTQQELADRIGMTRAYVSMIENGRKPVTTRSLMVALATALGVSVTDLTGQPYSPRSRGEMVMFRAAPAIRDALDDPGQDVPLVPLDELAARVDAAKQVRMACDYERLVEMLPPLLIQTRLYANGGSSEAERGLRLFVSVAHTASLALKAFGLVDLAMRLAERAEVAGRLLESPVEQAAAAFCVAQCALAGGLDGGRRQSFQLARRFAEVVEGHGNDGLAWATMLHLHAGLSAASLGNSDDARSHVAAAAELAPHVKGDPWRLEASPVNVQVWQVAIALENGEPGRAPEYAKRVDRAKIRTVTRRAALHIDAGRGLYLAGKPREAVRQFLEADALAPAETRMRPMVRELVGQMVRDARRAWGFDELRTLAARVGLDPLDPDEHLEQT